MILFLIAAKFLTLLENNFSDDKKPLDKPFSLPIFKNLFFLWAIISCRVISFNSPKFIFKDFFKFKSVRSLSL